MERLRHVPAGTVALAEFDRMRRRMWPHYACAAAFGTERLLARILGRAALSQAPAFAAPLAYPRAVMGPRLGVVIRPDATQRTLRSLVEFGGRRFRLDAWFVGFGDWRDVSLPSAEDAVVKAALALKAADFRFHDTPAYAVFRRRLEQGAPVVRNGRPLDSVVRIDSYFADFAALFQSVAQNGVLPHKAARRRFGRFARAQVDVGVAIDADGALLRLPGAQHRFAVAWALGCDIPAEVRMIHRDRLRAMLDQGPVRAVEAEVRRIAGAGRA